MNPLEFILFFSPIAIAYGLLKVKKWGWWYLLVYSVTLILYNLISFILLKDQYHGISLIQTIFTSALAIYFLKKDISAPYFKMYPRGWRGELRHPIATEIKINNRLIVTRDLSFSGFYVESSDFTFDLNEEVKFTFLINEALQFAVGVVRIDPNGVGFAFRNLSNENISLLKEIIK